MRIFGILLVLFCLCFTAVAQEEKKSSDSNKKNEDSKSIGGPEHNMDVYGVKLGMDIPTALKAVFENSGLNPSPQKPDALRKEGKKKKDIRVVYNNLPKGELQFVFAGGKVVREIVFKYKQRPNIETLRLPVTGQIGVAIDGLRFDDRYTIGWTDTLRQQRLWWRDLEIEKGYTMRLAFLSGNKLVDGQQWIQTVSAKRIFVTDKDVKKFNKAYGVKY